MTAAEVARVLGVKRQTVYAYVSRGILHRRLSLDGRTSLFDRAEVEELRLGRRPERDGEMRTILATRLTRVADEGLSIRGHDVIDLVGGGAGFVDLVELVWEGADGELWPAVADRTGPGPLGGAFAPGDATNLLEQLRALVALAAATDPLRHDLSPRGVRAAGRRAITAMVSGLRHQPDGREPSVSAAGPTGTVDPTLVAALWSQLSSQEPRPERLRALDVALALLVDHGLAASTLAARVAASVRADPYSVIIAGLGVLGGPLHGRASSEVHDLYRSAEEHGPAEALARLQRRGLSVPGFGHSVYRAQDPRYGPLLGEVVAGWSDDPRLRTVFAVRDVLAQRNEAIPNVDLALGALTFLAAMPANAGETIFAVGRTAGWLAHGLEEYGEKVARFRTRATYVGPSPGGVSRSTADRP